MPRIERQLNIGREKYPALTGVRTAGAIAVFFDHFPLAEHSHIVINVMAFFFVLSGFLIVRIYYERLEFRSEWLQQYFVNRFARIYPAYFLLLSVALCINHDYSPAVIVANFTLTHALFHKVALIIPPSWTLTVEECFYALAPVFMLLTGKSSFWTAFAFGWLLFAVALTVSNMQLSFLGTPDFLLSTTFFGHFVEFFAGMYLAFAVIRAEKNGSIELRVRWYTVCGFAGVLILIVAMMTVYGHEPFHPLAIILMNNFLIPIPIAILYFGLIREKTVIAKCLSNDLVRLLGRASYCFYLLHVLIIDHVSIPLLHVFDHRYLLVIATLIVTWMISVLLFLGYEQPMNALIRRRFCRSADFPSAHRPNRLLREPGE